MRTTGTISRGVRAPIIREGDDLPKIVVDSVLACAKENNAPMRDRDIVSITEAVVARAQGNYASIEEIAADVAEKFPSGVIGLTFPILSRNRFSICLRGIAGGVKKIYLLLSYPSDEVGNQLFDAEMLFGSGVDPYKDTLDEKAYREHFGYALHQFTGVDYVKYYTDLISECGCEVKIIFSNNVTAILDYVDEVLVCDIHTRERSKRALKAAGAKTVLGLDDIMTASVNGSGYNENYGLLGTNKATDNSVKLFPRDCETFVEAVRKDFADATGKKVEVMVYGDGAFKDPVGKIWELADPVVSPAYTDGLSGTPNELKLKYLADNNFAGLKGEELAEAIRGQITKKEGDLKGRMESQGTTPRRLTDLIGSLSDLTSGSGDKGTPFVWVQGYFDTYAQE